MSSSESTKEYVQRIGRELSHLRKVGALENFILFVSTPAIEKIHKRIGHVESDTYFIFKVIELIFTGWPQSEKEAFLKFISLMVIEDLAGDLVTQAKKDAAMEDLLKKFNQFKSNAPQN